MDLLIKHAKILIENTLEERDILIEKGKIKKVAPTIDGKGISASGLIALPGVIDTHVHFREPGQEHKEDYRSGSYASAAGGVTSVLTMPNVSPPTTTIKELEHVRKLARKSIVNYGFHFGATDDNFDEAESADNIASVKLYLGQSTGKMMVSEETLKHYLSNRQRVVVHAENQEQIDAKEKQFRHMTDPSVHSQIRTKEGAVSSLTRLFSLQRKCPVHVAHASTADEVILTKQQKNATVETSPSYLFLNTDDYDELGTKLRVNPAIREKNEQAKLWQAIDKIDCIATDHAPHTLEEKEQPYWNAPSGMPGVQTMMPLLLSAVNERKLSLDRLINLTSKTPAKIFSIGNKGILKKGYDADITLVDLKQEHTITDDEQLSKAGWTPFDGRKVIGMPVMTIVRGSIAYENGTVVNSSSAKEVTFLS